MFVTKASRMIIFKLSFIPSTTKGQSHKTFYTLEQIYKLVLKRNNMLWLRKLLVRVLGQYTLMYSKSNFFDRGTISNLGFFVAPARGLNCFIGLAPVFCIISELYLPCNFINYDKLCLKILNGTSLLYLVFVLKAKSNN